jgi:hypothetical protein
MRHWAVVTDLLRQAMGQLPSGERGLESVEEWLGHNELELAWDDLAQLGEERSAPPSFWLLLSDAASRMNLPEKAALAQRAARGGTGGKA